MGKRSGIPSSETEIAALSAEQIRSEIARCKMRLKIAKMQSNTLMRRAFEKRIHQLERIQRERGDL